MHLCVYLVDLAGETRLTHAQNDELMSTNSDADFPLLTYLFFMAHTALRLAFAPLLALHFETNRQMHQLEQQAMLRNPTSGLSPPGMADDSQEGKPQRHSFLLVSIRS